MLFRALLLSLAAFATSYVITPLTIPLCRTVGAIDYPDGNRKLNTHPTPRLGGLGFFSAAALVLSPLVTESATVAALLTSGAILCAGGVADDTWGLSPSLKFFIQTLSATVAIFFIGIPTEFSFLGLFSVSLGGILGFAFTVFRFVFTINAVNFSDGLDGLAAGLSVVAFLSLSLFGLINSNTLASVAALVLAFSVLGFLPYNKYHAKIFMGDCGSQFLGLAIALLSIGCSPGGSFTLESSLFLAVPTADTAISIVRRIIKKKSPFVADKGHLHHVLLKLGVPHPHAANLLVAASALVAAVTLLLLV